MDKTLIFRLKPESVIKWGAENLGFTNGITITLHYISEQLENQEVGLVGEQVIDAYATVEVKALEMNSVVRGLLTSDDNTKELYIYGQKLGGGDIEFYFPAAQRVGDISGSLSKMPDGFTITFNCYQDSNNNRWTITEL